MDDLPTLQISLTVPRIQHTVNMFIATEVDKLKAQIQEKIQQAELKRLDTLDEDIKKYVNDEVTRCLKFVVNEAICTQMNNEDFRTRIDKHVKEVLLKAF